MKLIIGDLIRYKDKNKKERVALYLGEYKDQLIVDRIKGKSRKIELIYKTDIIFKYKTGVESDYEIKSKKKL